jgi:hypothetical protein
LAASRSSARSSAGRGDEHFDEELGHRLDQRPVERPVEGDDRAEGRDRIGLEGAVVGRYQVSAASDAARVVVLDDDHGRLAEERDELSCGIGVEQVVPRQLLALELVMPPSTPSPPAMR